MGEEEIIALRSAKLERLRARGIDPYPTRFHPSHTAQQAVDLLEGGNESPVGEALLGKCVGDEVQVNAPAGALRWTIISVD